MRQRATFPYSRLQRLKANYTDNKLPAITKSFFMSAQMLDAMSKLIGKTEGGKTIDGFIVYLVRFDKTKDGDEVGQYIKEGTIQLANKNLTQVSFAIVPSTDYKQLGYKKSVRGTAKALRNKGKTIVIFPHGEHSGLCPVNCPT